MKPLFNLIPLDIIKKTFQLSNQHARTPESTLMKSTYRSPFPALNVKRINEPVATGTVYCNASAIYYGSKCAQALVGTKPPVSDFYEMKSDK